MLIRTEQTPNPATRKFLPGQTVMERARAISPTRGRRSFAAGRGPVRQRAGRRRVLRPRFHLGDRRAGRVVDRPRAAGARDPARPFRQRRAVVRAGHRGRNPHRRRAGDVEEDPADADIIDQIKELIETRVRPAVAQDGGDIVYKGYGRAAVSVDARRLLGLPVVDRDPEARDRKPDPPLRPRGRDRSKRSEFQGVAASRRMCPLSTP